MTVPCHFIKDILPLYLDNLVSRETGMFVHSHLIDCEECQSHLAELTAEVVPPALDPPLPEPTLERQVVSRIKRHVLISKMTFLALGALFGVYATSRSQLQAPFLVYPLIGLAGELMIGKLWVAPLVVFVFNTIGALIFWDFHFGYSVISAIFAMLALMGSLVAYCGKRVLE